MIIFQVLLSFDPVKEIMKIHVKCHIYIKNCKKVIILGKTHVTMKSFTPPFSTIKRKETYLRFSCRFITYIIRIRNLDWCKYGHCENEAREIYCLCCREVDAMLIASAKMPEREVRISPSSFYGQLPDY